MISVFKDDPSNDSSSGLVTGICLSVILIAATAVVGWLFELPRLTGVIFDAPPMALHTAIGAIAAAVALWPLRRRRTDAAGSAVIVLGSLAPIWFGLHIIVESWGIDLRAKDFLPGPAFDPAVTTIAPAVMLVGTGVALLLLWRRQIVAAQWIAIGLGFTNIFAFEGFLYERISTDDTAPAFGRAAIQTIACFVLLAVGILGARKREGLLTAFSGNRPGGLMARKVWLPLLVLVIAMGVVVEWLQQTGRINPQTDSPILVLWIVGLSTVLIWRNARALNRLDDELRKSIGDREHAELSLRRQTSLFDQAYEAMVMWRVDGTITFWNRGAEQLYGYKREGAIGQNAHELLRTSVPGGVPLVLDQLNRSRHWEGQLHHRHRDGRELIVDSRMTLVEDPEGVNVVEASRDITERVRAQSALLDSERRFREIAEWLPQLVWTCEPDGWCDFLSQRWLDYTGSTLSREIGYGWLQQVHPEDQPELMARWRASVEQGAEFRAEFRIRRRDGAYRWFDTRALPLKNEHGAIIKWFGSNTDIEDAREFRETLRTSEERLALALEINQTVAWEMDLKSGTVSRSLEHDRIFGYEELQPVWTMDTFLRHIVPEDRDRIRRRFERTMTSATDDWSFDCQIQRVDGATRWIAVRGRSKRGESGAIDTLAGVVQDVTARKQIEAEILQLNTDLEGRVEQRTQALEAANRELEAFSYSVSHDLRAPLRTVDGFAQAVLEDFADELPVEGQRYLKIVRDGAQRMGRLIDDLLAFSRLSRVPLATRTVDMHALACESWKEVLGHDARRDVELHTDALPECAGDPALLKQVWINLLSNALKYTRDSRPAEVHIGYDRDARGAYFVKDNGTGFDMQYAHKLFGVFQRLHRSEDFEGTGVGLAVVQRIIHRHGGRIWADAEVGHGATFFFTVESEGRHEPPG